ncbi:hypothetical protein [Vallitalea guaymasensis]|uniref:hypothetical protein n=1 Tax=Vallitalea guaymasensis TaxID=1185412 RepID=UPI000DE4FDB1|nr:hypothetical protein [Vallitalea guaymasensis]
MRFTQISLKRKIIMIVAITLSLISIVIINNTIKKNKHDRFVNAFENDMAKLMVSIDIYDIKETLLTNENKEIIKNVKKIIEDTALSEEEKDSVPYLSRKKEYLLMENIFERVSDWYNQTRFEKNRIVDHILGQQVMYKAYLENQ